MQGNSCIFLVILGLSGLNFTASQQNEHTYELPEHLRDIRCREDDPALNECIRKAIQSGIHFFKTGIPAINVPVVDPFHIHKVNYQFSNNIVKGKIRLRNINVKGLSDITVKNVDYSRKGNRIHTIVDAAMPRLIIDGDHRADVVINNVKIVSNGSFSLTMINFVVKAVMDTELYERDGREHDRVLKVNFEINADDMKIKADGLFPEPALNDAIVLFINDNWRQLYKTIFAEARPMWEPTVVKFVNNYTSHIPHDLLIAKNP
uniref:Uncharacterized protein n=1 Tax=Glossina morsitans morsitans TaxID=37546 RepID=A0A1B0FQZ6_GLOMM